ncbi:unnamed protein product [Cylicocyclus nassatus]|uniref:Gelsolin-like domain-containing protein n=1 Tax=Cylicocyclus nassatus TaxID=53992 RepID=A0AA36GM15_CYLNA|nr:unnamed protein product [Cylicocyclus nassatus]
MSSYVDLSAVGKRNGLEIWRIKNLSLEPVPRSEYGQFYTGDAYVCLNTADQTWNLHVWVGESATADEVGSAGMAAARIDIALGGRATQHREVQKHESSLFLSYFPYGIRYLKGGYDSAVRAERLPSNLEPRLYHCEGKRNVRCSEVDCKPESLNLCDVFILDLGSEIYIWMPPDSGRLEKIKGMEIAKHMSEDERNNKAHVNVVDSDWNTNEAFWSHSGGVQNASHIKKTRDVEQQSYYEKPVDRSALYRVSDASGRLEVTKVAEGEIKQSQLDSQDAFILDARGGVYVWLGKGCTPNERKRALQWGENYIKQKNLPQWTQVTCIREGDETPSFTRWFPDWTQASQARELYTPRLYQVYDRPPDRLIVEEISNYTQESLDGDDVMILDAYDQIYIWIGACASQQEREGAAVIAKRYLEQEAPRRRINPNVLPIVYQGMEPEAFKAKFKKWDDNLFRGNARSVEGVKKRLFEKVL